MAFGLAALAQGADAPEVALRFEGDGEYRLQAWLEPAAEPRRKKREGMRYFGVLRVSGEGGSTAQFAIEAQPDAGSSQLCMRETCADVGIAVEDGHLYVPAAGLRAAGEPTIWLPTDEFTTHRAEASARLPSGLKIHRDVLVRPHLAVADCSDFPAADADRWTCLFGSELLPTMDATADDAALVAALPETLVQPKANYDLVFAEEFDAVAGAEGQCPGGFPRLDAVLDGRVWNHLPACDKIGSQGEPVQTVRDGHYEFTAISGVDTWAIRTLGKVAFKYGYLELKYTVDLRRPDGYTNLAVVLGRGDEQKRGGPSANHGRFGVEVDDYESLLRYTWIEVDLVEWVGTYGKSIWHQYVNWFPWVYREEVMPVWSSKAFRLCTGKQRWYEREFIPSGCGSGTTMTVTLGVEWTPRGWRTQYRVHELHDAMRVLRRSNIQVSHAPVDERNGDEVTWGTRTEFRGAGRDRYFELLVDGDEDSVLEQVGVSHLPLSLGIDGWGWPNNPDVRQRMRLDYVRVFQPRNRYADMEPVYQ
ncbi:MAG: hypothetical protein OXH15_21775 [Gammaproteobacteria bacterium]|nr:hypothetical protein [Gammaproteobacteria bacterium]